MKRFLAGLIVGLVLSGTAFAAGETSNYPVVRVIVNGKQTSDGVNLGGTTMVPLRAVSESLGADVQWTAATATTPQTVQVNAPVIIDTSTGPIEVFNPVLKDFSPLSWQDGVKQLDGTISGYAYIRSGDGHGVIGRMVPGQRDMFTRSGGVYDSTSIYGSPTGDFSAYDPTATHPPFLTFGPPNYAVNVAFVTKNTAFPQRIDPDDLAAFLESIR